MATLAYETFRVFFLDGRNVVLADRTMWTGTVDGVQIHPREIVRATLEAGATALILAHNHPSSSATPSDSDLAMTAQVVLACAPINVTVHDHLIIARDGAFSMRAAGIMAGFEASEAARRKACIDVSHD